MRKPSREEVRVIARDAGFVLHKFALDDLPTILTGSGDWNCFDVTNKLERFAAAMYAKGAEDMRERAANECVAVNQERTNAGYVHGYNAIMDCHDAIRALPITPTNTEGEQG